MPIVSSAKAWTVGNVAREEGGDRNHLVAEVLDVQQRGRKGHPSTAEVDGVEQLC